MKRVIIILFKILIWIFLFVLFIVINRWWVFFLFFVFGYLNLYIHEFGHALAGLVVKFTIRKITIGSGRELIRKKIGGFLITITNGLDYGDVRIGPVSGNFLKVRFLFFSFGGVLAQGFAIAITMALFSISLSELPAIRSVSIAHVFIYSNLFLIAINLFPKKIIISGVAYENDGLSLVRIPFHKNFDLQDINSAIEDLESYEMLKYKQFHEAEIGFKKRIEKHPELPVPQINLSVVYLKQLRFEEAIALLENLLVNNAEDKYSFLIYNNLAYAYLLRNEQNDLQKADEYSEKAFNANKKVPSILNTRGCILIEKGKIDEGIALLENTVNIKRKVDIKTDDPVSFIALAYGYYLKDEIEDALKYIKKFEYYYEDLDADDQMYLDHVISKTDNFNRGQKMVKAPAEKRTTVNK